MQRLALVSLSLLLSTSAGLTQGTEIIPGPEATPCGSVSLERCLEEQPHLALAQLETVAQAGSASAYEYKLLGDLYSSKGSLNAPSKAIAFYERSFQGGDPWAGMSLAQLLSTSQKAADANRAIEILEKVAEQGGDASQYAFYEAAELRVKRKSAGDAGSAHQNYAAALKAGNLWAALPLAQDMADGKTIPLERPELVAAIRQGISQDAEFFSEGLRALEGLADPKAQPAKSEVASTLRELTGRTDGIGDLAKVELGKRLATSQEAKTQKEGLQLLEQMARAGAKPAQFALGEMYAQSARTDKARRRAISLLQRGADGVPGLQAQAQFLMAEMYAAGSKASDKRKAIHHYEHAAAAGNSWASYKLALAYINGSAGQTSPRLARIYGERTYESGNIQAGIGALFSLHGTEYDLPATKLKSYVRNGVKTTPAPQIVEALTWVPLASQVRFAQKVLRDRGDYKGRIHGELNQRTVRSIQTICKKQGIKDCATDRISKPVLANLVSSLQ